MAKRVLSVGQCGADGPHLAAYLGRTFGAKVQGADTADEAMAMLHNGPFDLVLVNRIFDADGDSGIDFLKAVKADASTGKVPVMLVSNYADAQERAVAAGAERGFGKAELTTPAVAERLSPFLAETAADE